MIMEDTKLINQKLSEIQADMEERCSQLIDVAKIIDMCYIFSHKNNFDDHDEDDDADDDDVIMVVMTKLMTLCDVGQ